MYRLAEERLPPAADGFADRLHRCCLTRVRLKAQLSLSKLWRPCSRFEAKAKSSGLKAEETIFLRSPALPSGNTIQAKILRRSRAASKSNHKAMSGH